MYVCTLISYQLRNKLWQLLLNQIEENISAYHHHNSRVCNEIMNHRTEQKKADDIFDQTVFGVIAQL